MQTTRMRDFEGFAIVSGLKSILAVALCFVVGVSWVQGQCCNELSVQFNLTNFFVVSITLNNIYERSL